MSTRSCPRCSNRLARGDDRCNVCGRVWTAEPADGALDETDAIAGLSAVYDAVDRLREDELVDHCKGVRADLQRHL